MVLENKLGEVKSTFLHTINCLPNAKDLCPNESMIQGIQRNYSIYTCCIEMFYSLYNN